MKQKLILIADDNEVVLAFTARIVELMGYAVIKAENGKEAIEMAIENHPDLIILDWKMPIINGIEATEKLKKNPKTKDTPIIMITGTMDASELMALAFEKGVNDFLRKPFNKVELDARVKSQLSQAQYIKQIIELKNTELNHAAIQLANSLDFQKSLFSKLEILIEKVNEDEAKSIINDIISKIKLNEMFHPLENLNKRFSEININFTSNLLSKHPNLTPSEIKLSMLLRLNLNTKEIAILSYQTYDSVRVSRTRLREKLNLISSENLVNYLMQF